MVRVCCEYWMLDGCNVNVARAARHWCWFIDAGTNSSRLGLLTNWVEFVPRPGLFCSSTADWRVRQMQCSTIYSFVEKPEHSAAPGGIPTHRNVLHGSAAECCRLARPQYAHRQHLRWCQRDDLHKIGGPSASFTESVALVWFLLIFAVLSWNLISCYFKILTWSAVSFVVELSST